VDCVVLYLYTVADGQLFLCFWGEYGVYVGPEGRGMAPLVGAEMALWFGIDCMACGCLPTSAFRFSGICNGAMNGSRVKNENDLWMMSVKSASQRMYEAEVSL